MQDALDLLRNSTRITAVIFRCTFGLEGKEYGGEGVATEPFSSLFKPSNIMFINIKILKMKQKAKAFLCLSPCSLKTHGNVWSLSLLNFCYELKNCLLKTTICINFSCSWELSKKWISHTYHPINLFCFFTAKCVPGFGLPFFGLYGVFLHWFLWLAVEKYCDYNCSLLRCHLKPLSLHTRTTLLED